MTDHPYEYYRTSADGIYPVIATRLAQPFHELWWNDANFEDSRNQWGGLISGR